MGTEHGYSEKSVARLLSRLWRNPKTPIVEGGHCLEYDVYAGYVNEKGYARLSIDGTMRYAHRTALEVHLGRRLTSI